MTDQPKTPGAIGYVSYIGNGFVRVRLSGAAPKLESPVFAAPAEQTPAVGGEPKVVAYLCNAGTVLMLADQKDAAAWNAGHPLIELQDHRSHVAPLLAEIERLKATIEGRAEWIKEASARIDELEAQQGEPVAYLYTCPSDDYQRPEVRHCHFRAKVVAKDWLEEPLYLQAQLATAKVVLPERKASGIHRGHDADEGFKYGWNACLDEVAKRNP